MNSESSQKKEIEPLEEMKKILSSQEKVEEKIEAILQFMKDCLAQSDAPLFREFWEARKELIPLFKEVSSSYARSTLWKQLMEITGEAKKIRDILDEKSAFHVEQIEIALEALEKDVTTFSDKLAALEDPQFSHPSFQNREMKEKQKEADLLTNFAVRLSGLRKEILALDMRMRKKNTLLKRINAMQDSLLPKRKELMKEISEDYAKEVDKFEEKFSAPENEKRPLFQWKEEIKSLQSDGKRLSILPQTFGDTRKKLSKSWDLIRELQLGKKVERAKVKEQEEEHIVAGREKIALLKKALDEGESPTSCEKIKDEVQSFLRTLPLSRNSMRQLTQELDVLRKELAEKKESAIQQEREKERILVQELETFLQNKPQEKELEEKKKEFSDRFSALNLPPSEKKMVETLLQKLDDWQLTRKEEEILQNDPSKYDQVLAQKQERAKEIKARIEELKKEVSSSNLDFSKAITLQEMMEEEKQRLNNLNEEIASLEE